MCEPVTIGMAIVGVASAVAAQKGQADTVSDARAQQSAQSREMIKQFNFRDAQLNQEDRNDYEAAVQQLENNSINAIRNRGMIEAAFLDSGVEGRSVDAVVREVEGQDARVADSIRADYANQRRGTQAKSEQSFLETSGALAGQAKIRGPSAASSALAVINGGMQGAAAGSQLRGAYNAATAPKGTPPAKM
ncbi:internal virion protein [Ralstonia phage RSB2]|uniref:Putative internal virion protein B n=1 Tax=Ralstonia phage RSB2 TaxID=913183 RepID=E5RV23_9CAUD|nr:internal virion protein [Ralstonia phage RSB2]BAJ51831.1 putative internal virion protein B [Ralstonia phage RSB2]